MRYTIVIALSLIASPVRLAAQPSATEVEALVKALQSTEEKVRREALDEIGRSRTAIRAALPAVLKVAKNPDDSLYDGGIWALGFCGSQAEVVTPVLLEALKRKPFSINTISRLGLGPGAAEAIPVLAKTLRAAEELEANELEVKEAIVGALGRIGPKSLPILVEALNDEKANAEALNALGRWGADAAPAVPAILKLMGSTKNADLRRECIDALGEIGPGAKAAVPQLRNLLQDPDLSQRSGVLWALRGIGPDAKQALPDLIPLLDDDRERRSVIGQVHPPSLNELLDALNRIDPTQQEAITKGLAKRVARLVRDLKDGDEKVMQGAIFSLGGCGPHARSALPALVPVLKATSPGLRLDAAFALGWIDPENGQALEAWRALLTHRTTQIRSETVSAIRFFPMIAHACRAQLIDLLKDDDARVVVGAANALTSMGAEAATAVPALLEACKHPDPEVQIAAAEALSWIGDRKAIPGLRMAYQKAPARSKEEIGLALLHLDPELPESKLFLGKVLEKLSASLDATRGDVSFTFMLIKLARSAPRAKALAPLLKDHLHDDLAAGFLLLVDPIDDDAARVVTSRLRHMLDMARAPDGPDAPIGMDALELRFFAVRVLGNLGRRGAPALPVLEMATRDEYPRVREAARQAIAQIKSGK